MLNYLVFTLFALINTLAAPKIKVENPLLDAGEVKAGRKVRVAFKITNVGDAPLIIYNATTSCGCTVSKYPRKPILPNQTDSVMATYDSYKQKGYVHKTITITTNATPDKTNLTIRVKVL
jgi:uncharacterized protein (DUF58 family)